MSVASLGVCKELYEFSHWSDTDIWHGSQNDLLQKNDLGAYYPAYDLGYVLRKLPKCIQVDEMVGWLTLAEHETGWQCGYLMNAGYMEKMFCCSSETPENAVCELAIKLIRRGAIK